MDYFLNLTGAQKQVLITAGIRYEESRIFNGNLPAVVFHGDENFDQALRALGLQISAFYRSSNQRADCCYAITEVGTRRYSDNKILILRRGEGYVNVGKIIDITRVFQPMVNKEIVLHLQYGQKERRIRDGKFHIYFYSGHQESDHSIISNPSSIWGYHRNREAAYVPANRDDCKFIVDPATDWKVASFFEDNLFIHHKFYFDNHPDELAIYERLLIREVGAFFDPKLVLAATLARVAERRAESKALYVQLTTDDLAVRLGEAEEEFRTNREEIETAQSSLVAARQAQRVLLEPREERRESPEERFGLEFDKILAMPKVKSIEITDRTIIVYTKPLIALDDRTSRRHRIGEIEITISIGQTNADYLKRAITYRNLSHPDGMGGMIAPHVSKSAGPCYGNVTKGVLKLVNNYDYAALIMLLINFLESAKTNDAYGRHVSDFPVVK